MRHKLITHLKILLPYRTKVWREKSLATFPNHQTLLAKNFVIQLLLSVFQQFHQTLLIFLYFCKLFSRQTFVLYSTTINMLEILLNTL